MSLFAELPHECAAETSEEEEEEDEEEVEEEDNCELPT